MKEPQIQFPLWKKLAMTPVGLVAIPAGIVVLVPIFSLLLLAQFLWWAYFRSRLAVFGIPMPPPLFD